MLQTCVNPECSTQFSIDFGKCPGCGADAAGAPAKNILAGTTEHRPELKRFQDLALTIGQIVTLLLCLYIPFAVLASLKFGWEYASLIGPFGKGKFFVWMVFNASIEFFLTLAALTVFTRVKRLPP